jgi:hypothetical protein
MRKQLLAGGGGKAFAASPALKRACSYDEKVIFYFDHHDNKYVAKDGSLAWRLNNPGLLSSHSLAKINYKAIGTHGGRAIFPDLRTGKNALRAWILSPKYSKSPLQEIAKYYQPDNSENYLKGLNALTGIPSKAKPRSLSSTDFENLFNAIQKLAGFSPENEHAFLLLPKITSKFHSKDHKIELYLVGYEIILNRQEAIQWIETHQLDAVIVHKNNVDSTTKMRFKKHKIFQFLRKTHRVSGSILLQFPAIRKWSRKSSINIGKTSPNERCYISSIC